MKIDLSTLIYNLLYDAVMVYEIGMVEWLGYSLQMNGGKFDFHGVIVFTIIRMFVWIWSKLMCGSGK